MFLMLIISIIHNKERCESWENIVFFFFVCIFPIWHWTTQEHWHWHWDRREEISVSREITLVEKDWAVNCSRKEILLFSEFQILSENIFSTLVCTQRKRVSRTSPRFSFLRVTHHGYYFSQKTKTKIHYGYYYCQKLSLFRKVLGIKLLKCTPL